MRSRVLSVVLLAVAVQCPAETDSSPSSLRSGIDVQSIGQGGRPQDDFDLYVNGGWMASHPIPADAVRISAASQVNDNTREELRTIVESAASGPSTASDPDLQKIATLHLSFLDEATIERLGTQPLKADLDRIEAIHDRRDIAWLIGQLGVIGVSTPIGNSVLNDSRNPDAYIESLVQSGLGLPGRDYYLGDKPELQSIRAAYQSHIARMLKLSEKASADDASTNIVKLETAMAQAQWTVADSSDPSRNDNRFTLAQLQALAPEMDWARYFAGSESAGHVPQFVVHEPDYCKAVAYLVASTPVSTWKAYFRFHLLSAYAPYLTRAFVDEKLAFDSGQLRGVKENTPRWRRGVDLVEESMGEALGRLYVARYVSPQAKARVTAMVNNFVRAFSEDIDSLSWMRAETKQRAKEKLVTLHAKIGYPDHWRDYSSLQMVAGDLVGNVKRARAWEYRRNIAKLGRAVDRNEWYMTPQTPDAYEWLPQNEIVIGAAMLQPPFFDAEADDAVNYGAIGGTIGHELSHGFDNIGSQYDAHGVLLKKLGWFTPADLQRFEALTRALIAQYSAFEPLPGYHVNGEQTLSENIADVAGAAIAYRAYHLSLGGRPAPIIDGLTGDQRFFIGWAQKRRGNYRQQELIRIIASNEHSPPAIRAMAPLMNLDAFHRAFDIKPSDRMYLAPDKRVRIW